MFTVGFMTEPFSSILSSVTLPILPSVQSFISLLFSPHLSVLVSVTPFLNLWWQSGCWDTWFIDWEGLATHSFLSHHLLSGLGDSQDPGACAHTDTQSHTQRNISNIQCENFAEVSSPESHRCSSWHLSRLWWGGSGGLSGVWGAAEGQTGPQSLNESFLCGTQSIVCAGKGHEDGNTAQSWTLSSDSSSVSVCVFIWVRETSQSVGERKCVLAYDTQRRLLWACVCVHVCVRACVCVCACACVFEILQTAPSPIQRLTVKLCENLSGGVREQLEPNSSPKLASVLTAKTLASREHASTLSQQLPDSPFLSVRPALSCSLPQSYSRDQTTLWLILKSNRYASNPANWVNEKR